MEPRRKKKSSIGVIIGLIILIVILLLTLALLTKNEFSDSIKADVQTKVEKMAIEQAIKAETGESVDIDKVLEKMDEEDASTVNGMIEKYAQPEVIADGVDTLKTGDMDAIKDYVKENVDTEDISKVLELYDKYKDDFIE